MAKSFEEDFVKLLIPYFGKGISGLLHNISCDWKIKEFWAS
jgi:hypothetical protein